MESQGIEWVCPNCSKKKSEECNKPKLIPKKQSNSDDAMSHEQDRIPSVSNASTANDITLTSHSRRDSGTSTGITHCVVCKKEARKSSIYCSDACILAHAQVTSVKDKLSPVSQPSKPMKTDTPKLRTDVRIIVFDRKTGKVLTGEYLIKS